MNKNELNITEEIIDKALPELIHFLTILSDAGFKELHLDFRDGGVWALKGDSTYTNLCPCKCAEKGKREDDV